MMIYKIRNKKTGEYIGLWDQCFYSEHAIKTYLGRQTKRKEGLAGAACISGDWEIVEMMPEPKQNAIEFYIEKSAKFKKKAKI